MGVLQWIRDRIRTDEARAMPAGSGDGFMVHNLGAQVPTSGVPINEHKALSSPAVWACVRVISSAIAKLPLILYRRDREGGKTIATRNSVYNLLHTEPNSLMTSFVFRETLANHVLTWGNAYAEIERSNDGRPVALWPITPDRVRPKAVVTEGGKIEIEYHVRQNAGDSVVIPSRFMLHVPGLGYNGLVGYSPIRIQAESIGVSLAAQEFGGAFFGNGSTPGGVLSHPGSLKPEGRANLRKAWEEAHRTAKNGQRVAILEEGLKWEQVTIPPEEAQFIETQNFSVVQIARIYGVQPHKIQHLENATFTNIQEQNIEFVQDTLMSWLERFEQEYDRKLLTPRERQQGLFAKHDVRELLRGDSEARSAYYRELFYLGSINRNEIRSMEGMNPIEGGDEYYLQVNLAPASEIDAMSDDGGTEEVPANMQEPGGPATGPTVDEGDTDEDGDDGFREMVPTAEDRVQQAIDLHRPIIQDALDRITRRGVRAAERAAKRDGYEAWREEYLPKHQAHVRDVLTPLLAPFVATVEDVHDADGGGWSSVLLDGIVHRCCNEFEEGNTQDAGDTLRRLAEWIKDRGEHGTD